MVARISISALIMPALLLAAPAHAQAVEAVVTASAVPDLKLISTLITGIAMLGYAYTRRPWHRRENR